MERQAPAAVLLHLTAAASKALEASDSNGYALASRWSAPDSQTQGCTLTQSPANCLDHEPLTLACASCSQKTVTMTLWGETAHDKGPLLEAQDCPVITVTACRVSDYNGTIDYNECCNVHARTHSHTRTYSHTRTHTHTHAHAHAHADCNSWYRSSNWAL